MAEEMKKEMVNSGVLNYTNKVVYSSKTKTIKTNTDSSYKITKISSATNTKVPTGSGVPDPNTIITCYILNKLTDTVIKFPAYPTDVNESFSAEFNQKEVMGRSAPYFSFGGNGSRGVSYSVKVSDDICSDLMGLVNSIKGLIYPKYYGSIVQPPFCYVKFGEMISMTAIVESVDFSWGETILENSQHFSVVEINFSFQEMRLESIPTTTGIFNEGS